MKISKQELIDMGACNDGLTRFIEQTKNTDEQVEVSSLVGGENTYSDLLWLAGKKLDKEKIIRFSCDCALINIDLIRKYTDKYDLIVGFLKNPTAATRAAAYAATRVTRAAAYADADATADATAAAAAAAAAAAYAATRATRATRAADAADATRAAADAAYAAGSTKEKINELLIILFSDE